MQGAKVEGFDEDDALIPLVPGYFVGSSVGRSHSPCK